MSASDEKQSVEFAPRASLQSSHSFAFGGGFGGSRSGSIATSLPQLALGSSTQPLPPTARDQPNSHALTLGSKRAPRGSSTHRGSSPPRGPARAPLVAWGSNSSVSLPVISSRPSSRPPAARQTDHLPSRHDNTARAHTSRARLHSHDDGGDGEFDLPSPPASVPHSQTARASSSKSASRIGTAMSHWPASHAASATQLLPTTEEGLWSVRGEAGSDGVSARRGFSTSFRVSSDLAAAAQATQRANQRAAAIARKRESEERALAAAAEEARVRAELEAVEAASRPPPTELERRAKQLEDGTSRQPIYSLAEAPSPAVADRAELDAYLRSREGRGLFRVTSVTDEQVDQLMAGLAVVEPTSTSTTSHDDSPPPALLARTLARERRTFDNVEELLAAMVSARDTWSERRRRAFLAAGSRSRDAADTVDEESVLLAFLRSPRTTFFTASSGVRATPLDLASLVFEGGESLSTCLSHLRSLNDAAPAQHVRTMSHLIFAVAETEHACARRRTRKARLLDWINSTECTLRDERGTSVTATQLEDLFDDGAINKSPSSSSPSLSPSPPPPSTTPLLHSTSLVRMLLKVLQTQITEEPVVSSTTSNPWSRPRLLAQRIRETRDQLRALVRPLLARSRVASIVSRDSAESVSESSLARLLRRSTEGHADALLHLAQCSEHGVQFDDRATAVTGPEVDSESESDSDSDADKSEESEMDVARRASLDRLASYVHSQHLCYTRFQRDVHAWLNGRVESSEFEPHVVATTSNSAASASSASDKLDAPLVLHHHSAKDSVSASSTATDRTLADLPPCTLFRRADVDGQASSNAFSLISVARLMHLSRAHFETLAYLVSFARHNLVFRSVEGDLLAHLRTRVATDARQRSQERLVVLRHLLKPECRLLPFLQTALHEPASDALLVAHTTLITVGELDAMLEAVGTSGGGGDTASFGSTASERVLIYLRRLESEERRFLGGAHYRAKHGGCGETDTLAGASSTPAAEETTTDPLALDLSPVQELIYAIGASHAFATRCAEEVFLMLTAPSCTLLRGAEDSGALDDGSGVDVGRSSDKRSDDTTSPLLFSRADALRLCAEFVAPSQLLFYLCLVEAASSGEVEARQEVPEELVAPTSSSGRPTVDHLLATLTRVHRHRTNAVRDILARIRRQLDGDGDANGGLIVNEAGGVVGLGAESAEEAVRVLLDGGLGGGVPTDISALLTAVGAPESSWSLGATGRVSVGLVGESGRNGTALFPPPISALRTLERVLRVLYARRDKNTTPFKDIAALIDATRAEVKARVESHAQVLAFLLRPDVRLFGPSASLGDLKTTSVEDGALPRLVVTAADVEYIADQVPDAEHEDLLRYLREMDKRNREAELEVHTQEDDPTDVEVDATNDVTRSQQGRFSFAFASSSSSSRGARYFATVSSLASAVRRAHLLFRSALRECAELLAPEARLFARPSVAAALTTRDARDLLLTTMPPPRATRPDGELESEDETSFDEFTPVDGGVDEVPVGAENVLRLLRARRVSQQQQAEGTSSGAPVVPFASFAELRALVRRASGRVRDTDEAETRARAQPLIDVLTDPSRTPLTPTALRTMLASGELANARRVHDALWVASGAHDLAIRHLDLLGAWKLERARALGSLVEVSQALHVAHRTYQREQHDVLELLAEGRLWHQPLKHAAALGSTTPLFTPGDVASLMYDLSGLPLAVAAPVPALAFAPVSVSSLVRVVELLQARGQRFGSFAELRTAALAHVTQHVDAVMRVRALIDKHAANMTFAVSWPDLNRLVLACGGASASLELVLTQLIDEGRLNSTVTPTLAQLERHVRRARERAEETQRLLARLLADSDSHRLFTVVGSGDSAASRVSSVFLSSSAVEHGLFFGARSFDGFELTAHLSHLNVERGGARLVDPAEFARVLLLGSTAAAADNTTDQVVVVGPLDPSADPLTRRWTHDPRPPFTSLSSLVVELRRRVLAHEAARDRIQAILTSDEGRALVRTDTIDTASFTLRSFVSGLLHASHACDDDGARVVSLVQDLVRERASFASPSHVAAFLRTALVAVAIERETGVRAVVDLIVAHPNMTLLRRQRRPSETPSSSSSSSFICTERDAERIIVAAGDSTRTAMTLLWQLNDSAAMLTSSSSSGGTPAIDQLVELVSTEYARLDDHRLGTFEFLSSRAGGALFLSTGSSPEVEVTLRGVTRLFDRVQGGKDMLRLVCEARARGVRVATLADLAAPLAALHDEATTRARAEMAPLARHLSERTCTLWKVKSSSSSDAASDSVPATAQTPADLDTRRLELLLAAGRSEVPATDGFEAASITGLHLSAMERANARARRRSSIEPFKFTSVTDLISFVGALHARTVTRLFEMVTQAPAVEEADEADGVAESRIFQDDFNPHELRVADIDRFISRACTSDEEEEKQESDQDESLVAVYDLLSSLVELVRREGAGRCVNLDDLARATHEQSLNLRRARQQLRDRIRVWLDAHAAEVFGTVSAPDTGSTPPIVSKQTGTAAADLDLLLHAGRGIDLLAYLERVSKHFKQGRSFDEAEDHFLDQEDAEDEYAASSIRLSNGDSLSLSVARDIASDSSHVPPSDEVLDHLDRLIGSGLVAPFSSVGSFAAALGRRVRHLQDTARRVFLHLHTSDLLTDPFTGGRVRLRPVDVYTLFQQTRADTRLMQVLWQLDINDQEEVDQLADEEETPSHGATVGAGRSAVYFELMSELTLACQLVLATDRARVQTEHDLVRAFLNDAHECALFDNDDLAAAASATTESKPRVIIREHDLDLLLRAASGDDADVDDTTRGTHDVTCGRQALFHLRSLSLAGLKFSRLVPDLVDAVSASRRRLAQVQVEVWRHLRTSRILASTAPRPSLRRVETLFATHGFAIVPLVLAQFESTHSAGGGASAGPPRVFGSFAALSSAIGSEIGAVHAHLVGSTCRLLTPRVQSQLETSDAARLLAECADTRTCLALLEQAQRHSAGGARHDSLTQLQLLLRDLQRERTRMREEVLEFLRTAPAARKLFSAAPNASALLAALTTNQVDQLIFDGGANEHTLLHVHALAAASGPSSSIQSLDDLARAVRRRNTDDLERRKEECRQIMDLLASGDLRADLLVRTPDDANADSEAGTLPLFSEADASALLDASGGRLSGARAHLRHLAHETRDSYRTASDLIDAVGRVEIGAQQVRVDVELFLRSDKCTFWRPPPPSTTTIAAAESILPAALTPVHVFAVCDDGDAGPETMFYLWTACRERCRFHTVDQLVAYLRQSKLESHRRANDDDDDNVVDEQVAPVTDESVTVSEPPVEQNEEPPEPLPEPIVEAPQEADEPLPPEVEPPVAEEVAPEVVEPDEDPLDDADDAIAPRPRPKPRARQILSTICSVQ